MESQKDLIREFTQNDKWIIAVLDACRYDYFAEFYDADPARSPALNTQTWIQKVWTGQYDATYISGTPWIKRAFDSNNHFANVEDVWLYGWDKKTVPPENIVKAFKQNETDRMILHFMQPHLPYIGSPKLDSRELDRGPRVEDVVSKYGEAKVKEAYKGNLKRVIDEGVKPLIETGRRVAITADHGELLGEDGYYGHNEPDHEILRKIPWRVENEN